MSWAEACSSSLAKQQHGLLNEASAFGWAAVSSALTPPPPPPLYNAAAFFSSHAPQQIAASAVCAAVSGVLYVLWRKFDDARRRRIWSFYGRFCALTCSGSCALAVASAAWLHFLKNFYSADTTPETAAGHRIQNLYNMQVRTFNHNLVSKPHGIILSRTIALSCVYRRTVGLQRMPSDCPSRLDV